jgi:hypothetical protein
MCTIHPPKISTAMKSAASLRIIKQKLPVSPSLQPEVRIILASECGYHRTTTRENNRKQTRDRKKEDPKKLDPKSALPEQEKCPPKKRMKESARKAQNKLPGHAEPTPNPQRKVEKTKCWVSLSLERHPSKSHGILKRTGVMRRRSRRVDRSRCSRHRCRKHLAPFLLAVARGPAL